MRAIYLQHNDTGQLAKLNGNTLTVIRKKEDGFTVPGSVATVYEIAVISHVSEAYVHAMCGANISLSQNAWKEKLTALIHQLIA